MRKVPKPLPSKAAQCASQRPKAHLALGLDGRLLAVTGGEDVVRLYDVPTGKECGAPQNRGEVVHTLAFAPTGPILAAATGSPALHLWDVTVARTVPQGPPRVTLKERAVYPKEGLPFAFSPDGRTLASGRPAGGVRLRVVASGQERTSAAGPKNGMLHLGFTPDGKTLLVRAGETFRPEDVRL